MEYTVKAVKEVGEPDNYGNKAYSVMFESGDVVFMKAQKPPVVNTVEFGHIEEIEKQNKPGETYKRFKRDKREEGSTPSVASKPTVNPSQDRLVLIENKLDKALDMLEELRSSNNTDPADIPSDTTDYSDDEINLDDIPF